MVVLLLPGVLETLGAVGSRGQSAEVQDLVDYNTALAEENRTLQDSIGKAICSPDGTYDVPPSGEAPHSQDDIDERLEREDAKSGAIEVTLAWDGPSDLDLSVTCPGGPTIGQTIMFNNKRACGGEHDIDMNDGRNNSDRPIEHITWAEGAAPPGEYKVNVNYFNARGAQSSIPYTIEIKIGDKVKRLSKTAECCGTAAFVDSFIIGEAGDGGSADGSGGQGTDGGGTPPADGGEQKETPPLPKDPEDTVIKRDGTDVPLNEALEKGVVFILAKDTAAGSASSGSGFLISDRRVVTNRHVVEGANEILIVSKAIGSVRTARVIAITPNSVEGQLDFAVLETEASMAPAVPLTLTTAAERLQQVIAAGFPGFVFELDERFSQNDLTSMPEVVTTEGIIARPARETNSAPLIMHSADIAPGNSGGPLMDLCGRVIGVNTLGGESEKSYHSNWAISSVGLLSFLQSNGIEAASETDQCVPATSEHAETQPPAGQGG